MKNKTLKEKIFTLRRDKETGHPEDILLVSDVKEFIDEILGEIDNWWIKNFAPTGDEPLIKIKKIIKQKSGELE